MLVLVLRCNATAHTVLHVSRGPCDSGPESMRDAKVLLTSAVDFVSLSRSSEDVRQCCNEISLQSLADDQ